MRRWIRRGEPKRYFEIMEGILLLFVGFYLIEQIYQKNFGLTVGQFRLLTGVLFAPFIWATLLKKKNAFQDLGSLYFYSFIAGSAYLTYMYVHPA